jgi:hypothetical protein
VIFEITSGIGMRGFMSVEKVSIISKVFSSNFTSATSIILSVSFKTHVVSRSRATII